jgi:hypothetical protein
VLKVRTVVGAVSLPWYLLDEPTREEVKPEDPVKIKPGKVVLGHSGSWELVLDVTKNNS